MTEKDLIQSARAAMKMSYSPYSNCTVGAALLCDNEKVYCGCNIENASFSPTICAERTAFFKAVSEGERKFKMIAVCGECNGEGDRPFYPCGVCRQVMAEFCGPDFIVLVATADAGYEKFTLSDLLPHTFSIEKGSN